MSGFFLFRFRPPDPRARTTRRRESSRDDANVSIDRHARNTAMLPSLTRDRDAVHFAGVVLRDAFFSAFLAASFSARFASFFSASFCSFSAWRCE